LLAAGTAAVAFHKHAVQQRSFRTSMLEPLTVRSLLESDELTDLATDNMMVLGSDALSHDDRHEVRDRVAKHLKNISHTIRDRSPESYRKLELIKLNEEKKGSVLRALRKYGDPRMVGLAREVAEATRQAKEEGGDHESFTRRLSEKLGSRLADMKQLGSELFPDQKISLDADALVPKLRKWNPKIEVDWSDSSDKPATQRRLSAQTGDAVDEGVHTQAKTLFRSLHRELGEEMPQAPARMLFSFDESDSSSSTSSSSGTDDVEKKASFMTCCMKAVPNPTKVASCIMDNISEAVDMVTKFMR